MGQSQRRLADRVIKNSLVLAVSSLTFIVVFHYVERISVGESFQAIGVSAPLAIVLGVGARYFACAIHSWTGLLLAAMSFGLLYLGGLAAFSWPEPDDLKLVRHYATKYLPWRRL